MRYITFATMKQPTTFAELRSNVTLVAVGHITGRLGTLPSNVTLGTGRLTALPLRLGHITFRELKGWIEAALEGVQPFHGDACLVPARLEGGLLEVGYALHEIQLTTVAEAQPRPFARHGGGLYA